MNRVERGELFGLWSVDARYGPGAQGDSQLFLGADGLGYLEDATLGSSDVHVLEWTLDRGIVSIHVVAHYARLDRGRYERTATVPGLDVTAPARVADDPTPRGDVMRVLYLEVPDEGPHWARRSWGRVGDDPYPAIARQLRRHGS